MKATEAALAVSGMNCGSKGFRHHVKSPSLPSSAASLLFLLFLFEFLLRLLPLLPLAKAAEPSMMSAMLLLAVPSLPASWSTVMLTPRPLLRPLRLLPLLKERALKLALRLFRRWRCSKYIGS